MPAIELARIGIFPPDFSPFLCLSLYPDSSAFPIRLPKGKWESGRSRRLNDSDIVDFAFYWSVSTPRSPTPSTIPLPHRHRCSPFAWPLHELLHFLSGLFCPQPPRHRTWCSSSFRASVGLLRPLTLYPVNVEVSVLPISNREAFNTSAHFSYVGGANTQSNPVYVVNPGWRPRRDPAHVTLTA